LEENKLYIRHLNNSIKAGIGYINENSKMKGLMIEASIRENNSLNNMKNISKHGVISTAKEKPLVQQLIERLNVKSTNKEQTVKSLSGGNQQKVVIAKWLGIQPKILILDEPTRGVDVGAKKEIYKIINELTKEGVAIIMISSELPEVLGVSDRIMVIHEGTITKTFQKNDADQEKIMIAATGGE